jgi:lipoprotein-anchoring transpeptidase ErfK/SrfK
MAAFVASSVTAFTQATPTQPPPSPEAAAASLALQVQLARAGFSTGEIDGVDGANTQKALAAHVAAHKAAPDATGDTLEDYVLTADDVEGPFITIPADIMEKAKLRSLGYTSLIESLGERFHTAPALLTSLNPGVTFASGTTIKVPKVDRTVPARDKIPAAAGAPDAAGDVIVFVSKGESSVRVYTRTGTLVMYAPVTSGSEHDPLPIGDWTVTAVAHDPPFNYNPDLFWDADASHGKAIIPPGPNGPVGVVWIDISKEHYGLHGTPEPSTIGHTSSHGCVRLTNWDALKLAALVTKGTQVRFVE